MSQHRKAGRAATNRDRTVGDGPRPLRENILIVCEGRATEPNYFQAIIETHRLNTIERQIDTFGVGRGALALTEYALSLQRTGKDRYAQIWCVFDKDDFPSADFDNAIVRAKNHNVLRVAWSNEAFELWYVLHFQYLDSATGYAAGKARDYYKARLTKLLQGLGHAKYEKNDPTLYALLKPDRLQTAIRYARRLQEFHNAETPYHQRQPGTTVHELVELLLSYATPEHQ